ncbi:MAG: putative addiction module antidote protein [Deltaproteobacteria bacterium RIFOXYA12_FULL_58_15]|nr:MAG: putative addiction module antidote protein [Deltaproteobacteria bacterium RIFOXYA12_FULL_58_15]OGR11142.1 MAG: putative addiction module antidote protein [Deltaproteobacteria bacterium RIFOXYB12_FULL_58_9]
MPKRTRRYEESLHEDLKDPDEAAAYLNAHLEDESADSDELFLLALRDVAKAHGFTEVAQNAELGRESLYKALSATGNPRLSTLSSLLKVMGLRLAVEVEGNQRKSA